eukprot:6106152-Amphidinium_carterae.2
MELNMWLRICEDLLALPGELSFNRIGDRDIELVSQPPRITTNAQEESLPRTAQGGSFDLLEVH